MSAYETIGHARLIEHYDFPKGSRWEAEGRRTVVVLGCVEDIRGLHVSTVSACETEFQTLHRDDFTRIYRRAS